MDEPTILLPLDGSPTSEEAVGLARTLALATKARILLLGVWEEDGSEGMTHDALEGHRRRGLDELRAYLAGVAEMVSRDGISADTRVLVGKPADEILHVIEDEDPRFAVLSTHGRSGISRWRYGSVTARLIREAPLATVVVGPDARGRSTERVAIRRILVPLDGSPLAEAALPPAVELADALDASIVLARVVGFPVQTAAIPEVDYSLVDRELTLAASEYLQSVKARAGKRIVETHVLRGTPAEALTSLEEGEGIDLLIMTSHARAGLVRAVLGSVADRMLHGKAPVLLVRPEGAMPIAGRPRGRYCHNCGRSSPYVNVLAEDVCLRCGQHLHTCANCAYFDGLACLIRRPEAHSVPPGIDCPDFQFRETERPDIRRPVITSQRE
jgi:nucleotide-binding universal stress UspA family protein